MKACALVIALSWTASAQSTGSLVAIMVRDAITGAPLDRAQLTCIHLDTAMPCLAQRASDGAFWLRSLTPGAYRFRAEVTPEVDSGGLVRRRYQAREAARIEIPVAGLIFLDFDLRPENDLWEAGQFRSMFTPGGRASIAFYGPDVDLSRAGSFLPPERQENRLDASLSTVVNPLEVQNLPLAGRDLFATLTLQPMVTTSSTTSRGLGLYVNGQRAYSTNYLLDGVETNAYLTSGPQFVLPPEAAQEYRISIANYTAEYGGSSGLIANAVTLSGGRAWHGLGYGYLANEAFNANDITTRYEGLPRAPYKQIEAGMQVAGPLRPERLFGSFLWDGFRSRGVSPCEEHVVPSAASLDQAAANGASLAQYLLARFPAIKDQLCTPRVVSNEPLCPFCSMIRTRPSETTERQTALIRFDAVLKEGVRWMTRAAGSRSRRPDYVSSPYQGLESGLDQFNGQVMTTVVLGSPRITHEFRAAYGVDALLFSRAAPEVPRLLATDVELPSSGLDVNFDHRGRSLQLIYQLSLTSGKHALRAGGTWTKRSQTGRLDAGPGVYRFGGLQEFLKDRPYSYDLRLSRLDAAANALAMPETNRSYRYRTYSLFAHDSYRLNRRLTISGGVRLESFGAPAMFGPGRDVVVDLPGSPDSEGSLSAAKPVWGSIGSPVFPSNNRWSFRSGIAFAIDDKGRTILRGGVGTFFDRVFDNVWLNVQQNQYAAAGASISQIHPNYLLPVKELLADFYSRTQAPGRVRLTPLIDSDRVIAFDPRFSPGRVTSVFSAVEQALGRNWQLEVAGAWTRGDDLFVNDEVNRKIEGLRPNSALPPVFLRSNAGFSSGRAWSARVRWRARSLSLQAAYTNSWSRDNQSDPLSGDFDLLRTQTQRRQAAPGYASFSRAFDSTIDSGPSDWDQRHNLVFYSVLQLPTYWVDSRIAWLFRDWTFSQAGSIRSGTPFSVLAETGTEGIRNRRADLAGCADASIDRPMERGRRLLDKNCFAEPADRSPGGTGRNAFHGPGAWNFDLSISRWVRASWLGDSGRITFRADVFNLFNHANLNNPEGKLSCTGPSSECTGEFGQALYGRRESGSYFPAQRPFTETGRQILLMLRVSF